MWARVIAISRRAKANQYFIAKLDAIAQGRKRKLKVRKPELSIAAQVRKPELSLAAQVRKWIELERIEKLLWE